jgi:class 3 adenylate cyclase
MGWRYDRSRDRIKEHLDSIGDIEIEKLVKEADLDSLLTETRCREIFGTHVYISVSNFARLVAETSTDTEFRRLIQAVHIYQREASRLVEDSKLFDGVRVHFQGPKLHALFYRPIDDGRALATRALLIQLVLRDFTRSIFNPAFPHFDNFVVSGGADIGSVIGTRNGSKGDRELLFLGSPANRAAKIIRGHGILRITDRLFDALPEDLQDLCTPVGDGEDYRVDPVEDDELDALLAEHGFAWDREASAERVDDDLDAFPLKVIDYSCAFELIDFDELSIRNNKKVQAASIFADVSGFTAYIESAADDREAQQSALRVFHALRKELARVIRNDFGGVRVQYQGDRIQGVFHLPKGDTEAIALKTVETAGGLHSSMELALKAVLPEAETLHLAVGIDHGTTLASKLGSRGHRDRICLGQAVEEAADHEEKCGPCETGIGTTVHAVLPEELQGLFAWNEAAGCYIAPNLRAEKLERLRRAVELYASGNGPGLITSGAAGTTISVQEREDARRVVPARSYLP